MRASYDPAFLVAAAAVLVLSAACTERQTVSGAGPLPVGATAYPSPAKEAPQDIQELPIRISNGRFESDRYAAQNRATRLTITTQEGPYTFSIDSLLQPQELPANATTQIGLTLPNPGDYQMKVTGGDSEAYAVLNVRPVGAR